MLKVEIVDDAVSERTGTNAKGAWSLRTQQGILVIGPFRYPLEIALDRGQGSFSKGSYVVDDTTFSVDNYSRMVVKRLVLKPAAAVVAPVAGAAQR